MKYSAYSCRSLCEHAAVALMTGCEASQTKVPNWVEMVTRQPLRKTLSG